MLEGTTIKSEDLQAALADVERDLQKEGLPNDDQALLWNQKAVIFRLLGWDQELKEALARAREIDPQNSMIVACWG